MIIKTAGVVIFRDNEVLLVKHKSSAGHETGVYGLPAGRIEENETDIQAAVREVKEETGLDVLEENLKSIEQLYTADIKRKDGSIKTFSLKAFYCEVFSGDIIESDESEPVWINIDNVGECTLLPNVEKIIKDSIAQR